MDFPLDIPIPDGTLIAGAVLFIRGVDEDGIGTWYVRESGELDPWAKFGFLAGYVAKLQQDAIEAWTDEEDE